MNQRRLAPGCLGLALLLLTPLLLLQVTGEALAKLALPPGWSSLLVAAVLLGSQLNLPLWARRVSVPVRVPSLAFGGWARLESVQVVAINVGGGLVPVLLAVYELVRLPAEQWPVFLLCLAAVSLVARASSRFVPGQGVMMVPFWPGLTAAVFCSGEPGCALAAGVLGVVLGADLSRLGECWRDRLGVISIGGAGTFDGIVMAGLLAIYLA